MNRILYDRFTSQNDTGIGAALKDSELREAVNVFFGDGSATTRPGTKLLHAIDSLPAGGELVDAYDFLSQTLLVYKMPPAGSVTYNLYKVTVPMIGINPPWTLRLVKSGLVNQPTFLQLRTVLYVADGDNLYEYGKVDWYTSSGTLDLAVDDVVKNTPASSGGGSDGHFYRSKLARTGVNLATESFTNSTNWELLNFITTEAPEFFRAVRPKNAATKEKVKLVIGYNAAAAGNVTVTLNKVSKTVAIASGDTATTVAGKIRAAAYTGWTTSGSGQTVFFEAATAGRMDDTDHEYDAGVTQAYGVMSVSVQGKADDNDFARLKKCQTFVQHPKSRRVFAVGDPSDLTCVFLSGSVQYPDDMTYWSKGSQLYPTTPEKAAVALHVLTDAMLVGFTSNWYAYEGVDPAVDATWRRLNLPIGPISHRGVVAVPNGFIFLTRLKTLHFVSSNILNSEIILLQGQEIVRDLTSQRMERFIQDAFTGMAIDSRALQVDAVYFDGKVFLALHPTAIMVYDLTRDGFSTLEGWCVNRWYVRPDGTLLIAGSVQPLLFDDTRVKDVDPVTGADVPIHTVVRSKDFDLGDDLSSKMLMDVTVMLKQYTGTDAQTADIVVLGDYAKNASEGLSLEYDQVYLDESMVWGRSWGRIWGFSEVMTLTGHPNSVSRAFGVRVESYSPIGLYGIGFGFKKLRLQGREMTSGRELIE